MGYDRFPEQLIEEKEAFLDDKIERGVRLFFTHDVGCALARAKRDQQGKFQATEELSTVAGIVLEGLAP
jgi:hypothetical protein